MKRTIISILCTLNITLLAAETKVAADSAYAREEYDKAIELYETTLEKGKNATVYYNLGNCYYRTHQIGKAVLNYERAHELEPRDSQIRFNLDMARSKTVDKIPPSSEMFFITWARSIKNLHTADSWAIFANIAFLLALIFLAIYLFGRGLLLKKIAFFTSLFLFCATLTNHLFAYSQRRTQNERNQAIVMEDAVKVRSTPNESGAELFELHEGTKVIITDNNMKEWKEIRLANGKIGWMPTSSLELI